MFIKQRLKTKSISLILITVLNLTTLVANGAITLTANLGYVSVQHFPEGDKTLNPIRLKAIKETAMEIGARGALAWESLHINQSLSPEAQHLDHIFNFNKLLIDNAVLPPVITQSNNDINLDTHDTVRLASKTYEIISPARFVSVAPTWRNYLWMHYEKPTLPNKALLPSTKTEARLWNYYLKQGWLSGLQQANAIFRQNLDRLKRDYNGMALYSSLLAQHIANKPVIARAQLGVTGNANKLRVNDRVLRITSPSQLQPNAKKWTPIITQ